MAQVSERKVGCLTVGNRPILAAAVNHQSATVIVDLVHIDLVIASSPNNHVFSRKRLAALDHRVQPIDDLPEIRRQALTASSSFARVRNGIDASVLGDPMYGVSQCHPRRRSKKPLGNIL